MPRRRLDLLHRFELRTPAAGPDHEALVDAMRRDKKNQKGNVRFVLPRSIGLVELTDVPSPEDIRAVVANL